MNSINYCFLTVEELLILCSNRQDNLEQAEAQRRGSNLAAGVRRGSVNGQNTSRTASLP